MAVAINKAIITRFDLKEGSNRKYYGISEKGNPYTMTLSNGVLQIQLAMHTKDAVDVKALKQELKPWKVVNVVAQPHTFMVFLRYNRNWEENIEYVLHWVDKYPELEKETHCPVCGRGDCDCIAPVMGLYYPTHRHCYDEQQEKKRSQYTTSEGNYFTGAIGAFVGALLVILLGLLAVYFTDIDFGIIYIMCGMAAVGGYRMAHGKYGSLTKPIIVLCCIWVFMIYLVLLVYVFAFSSISFGFFLYILPDLFSDIFNLGFILETSWFALLFYVIGIFIALRQPELSAKVSLEILDNEDSLVKPLATNSLYDSFHYPNDHFNMEG